MTQDQLQEVLSALEALAGLVRDAIDAPEPVEPKKPDDSDQIIVGKNLGDATVLNLGAEVSPGKFTAGTWTKILPTISWSTETKFLSVLDGGVLRQSYVPSNIGTDKVIARSPIAPHRAYRLSQHVKFEKGFEWGARYQGGKIGFGLGGGTNPSGGEVDTGGMTARMMWRGHYLGNGKYDGTADLVMYTYNADRPDAVGQDTVIGTFKIPIDEWFHSIFEVVLNSATNKADGSMRVWINGKQELVKNGIAWQTSGGTPVIDTLWYSSFFGGGSEEWSPSKTVFAQFKNVCFAPVVNGYCGIDPDNGRLYLPSDSDVEKGEDTDRVIELRHATGVLAGAEDVFEIYDSAPVEGTRYDLFCDDVDVASSVLTPEKSIKGVRLPTDGKAHVMKLSPPNLPDMPYFGPVFLNVVASGGEGPKKETTDESGYFTKSIPVSEGQYTDFSQGIDKGVTRNLLTTLGCDMEKLHKAIGDQVYECDPTAEEIQKAIVRASTTGGIVKPRTADKIDINSVIPTLENNVGFDGSRIGRFDMSGEDRRSVIYAFGKENVAVTGIKSDGNNDLNYTININECRNVLVQNVESSNQDQNAIRMSTLSLDTTVRYCTIRTGRDTEGNGTQRNQHCAVWGSQEGPGVWPASSDFGIVFSHGVAAYSNIMVDSDGHAFDVHAANGEICGNWCDNNQRGSKFPHSQNLLIHRNRFGGVKANENGSIVSRVYSGNDWGKGVGRQCGNLFFFLNVYEDNDGNELRVDGIHQTAYWLHNTYRDNGGVFVIAHANEKASDPLSFFGSVGMAGSDLDQPRGGSAVDKVFEVTDQRLIDLDYMRMIEMMNEPLDKSWAANESHPLPSVFARQPMMMGS